MYTREHSTQGVRAQWRKNGEWGGGPRQRYFETHQSGQDPAGGPSCNPCGRLGPCGSASRALSGRLGPKMGFFPEQGSSPQGSEKMKGLLSISQIRTRGSERPLNWASATGSVTSALLCRVPSMGWGRRLIVMDPAGPCPAVKHRWYLRAAATCGRKCRYGDLET